MSIQRPLRFARILYRSKVRVLASVAPWVHSACTATAPLFQTGSKTAHAGDVQGDTCFGEVWRFLGVCKIAEIM